MAHGTPDWGLVGPKTTVYGLDDLGEHAVRLGSPHLWDRRGDVYYSTDFSEGFGALTPVIGGAGDTVLLHAGYTRCGGFCAKLTPGSAAFHLAGFHGTFTVPRVSGMGLEYSFSTDDGHDNWLWSLSWHLGVDRYLADVQFDLVNSRLRYWDAGGGWQTFAENVPWLNLERISNTGKLVVDSVKWEYSRFLLNRQEYPLAGIAVRHTTVAPALADTFFRVLIQLTGLPPENFYGFLDSVIVTQNEPV